ncbi:energy-coupling factor transporter ATP-binding protein EcfA2/energy-coupling factor transporter transmembrane protein EcfT [Microbacterium sp. W4I4]|uniref:energy-coupling factor transporter ATPase n=1 Tax=Microbacterium sp. W4I4 TaxID=3042295 RepID=UPI002783A902|nr:energy-coupling factor transporter ATPase [Microbacterium sp. W4I4]MDQ0614210.1 energy-coupling factor transporter ATP-binding protein EcfA2/energy-coupling factor transporter transmembrane protein EcfT [Microbacterium sp. W4I4]
MRTSAPLLRVQNLTVTHVDAAHPAPQDVSFEIRPGEIVLLLGPSGSGKSTLTLALNGLIPESVEATMTGLVEVAGRDTRETPVAQLSTDISMVFQDPDSQLVTGTVLDEVAFGLENLLLPASEVLQRAERALRQVGLWGRRAWNPDLLSGGGRQRLAIACALAMRSRVIVLDEPTANLDPQGVTDVYGALAELTRDADRAIVLVEHNLDAAIGLATRVIVLDHDGRMLLDGPARQTLHDNADRLHELGVWLPSELLQSAATGSLSLSMRGPSTSSGPQDAEAGTTGAEPAITVRNLVVQKARETVLDIPELDIAEGSFTAVVGANGAGKTTLLQALGGVVPAPHGAVMIGDLDAGRATPRRLASHVGFVFQNPEHQFIAHTVREELAHGLRLQRVDAAEIDARVDEMLDRFGLRYRAEEHPFLLSGGEKRRLSVGTALITRPRVIALDEPTFGQDRARAAELLDLLQDLQRAGTTIVIVTHDLDLVAAYATHTVVLADGAVLAAGLTAEVISEARPRNGGMADAALAPSGTWPEHPSEKVPVAQHPSRRSWDMPGGDSWGGDPVTEPSPTDPYSEVPASPRLWLHHLNPLSKIAAVLPAMALLVVTRDLITPTVFLVLSYVLVLTGARITRRTAALLIGMPVGIAVLTVGFSIWIDPAQVAGTGTVLRLGDWELYRGALLIGLTTVLRLAAILALALIGGLTTSGPDLVRAAVQQLHLPYRIGYTALAAYRFVPRFGYELSVIRAAHRVRGHGSGGPFGGRDPISRLVRGWGYIVPLLASGIRHAERVALSMDSRAFGAHPTRTERHISPFRTRDMVFIVAVIAASAAIFTATFPWQLG